MQPELRQPTCACPRVGLAAGLRVGGEARPVRGKRIHHRGPAHPPWRRRVDEQLDLFRQLEVGSQGGPTYDGEVRRQLIEHVDRSRLGRLDEDVAASAISDRVGDVEHRCIQVEDFDLARVEVEHRGHRLAGRACCVGRRCDLTAEGRAVHDDAPGRPRGGGAEPVQQGHGGQLHRRC